MQGLARSRSVKEGEGDDARPVAEGEEIPSSQGVPKAEVESTDTQETLDLPSRETVAVKAPAPSAWQGKSIAEWKYKTHECDTCAVTYPTEEEENLARETAEAIGTAAATLSRDRPSASRGGLWVTESGHAGRRAEKRLSLKINVPLDGSTNPTFVNMTRTAPDACAPLNIEISGKKYMRLTKPDDPEGVAIYEPMSSSDESAH